VLSGGVFGPLNKKPGHAQYASECLAIRDRSPRPVVSYPAIYFEGNWGGVYMNTLYHADAADKIVYSFPVSHEVLLYNRDFSHCDTVFMGSRYARDITESDLNTLKLILDENARIRYVISQHSYREVLYDTYRKVLYRIADHPLHGWKEEENFVQPFSIIIADSTGRVLSETPILQDSRELDSGNMHVCKEGLAIAEFKQGNEGKIVFRCYKLNAAHQ